MLVVSDINVIVSGLLNGTGKPGKVMDLVLENRFQVAYDNRIVGEYKNVLAQPELNIRPSRDGIMIVYNELTGLFVEMTYKIGKSWEERI